MRYRQSLNAVCSQIWRGLYEPTTKAGRISVPERIAEWKCEISGLPIQMPAHPPNQHTEAERKFIRKMQDRNPHWDGGTVAPAPQSRLYSLSGKPVPGSCTSGKYSPLLKTKTPYKAKSCEWM